MSSEYLRISNKDGKVWLLPKRHLKVALELYQPSSKQGELLKRLLPWTYWIKFLMKRLRIKEISYTIDVHIQHLIQTTLQNENLDYSVFEGTPSVHQKTTIQISKGNSILGYCKVTHNDNLYTIFLHEQKLLDFLNNKGVGRIPRCLFCGKVGHNEYIFLQTTTKTISSIVEHKLGRKQVEFLTTLNDKTSLEMHYHDSDQYKMIHSLQDNFDLLDDVQNIIMNEAINIIEAYYGNSTHVFCAYHADFTPWNMFVEAGKLFVFDFEYGSYTYMPYLDIFHFITQSAVFEKGKNANQIFKEITDCEPWLKKYFERPFMAYLIYLVDVIARFVVRDGHSRTNDVNKLIQTWFALMRMVIASIGNLE